MSEVLAGKAGSDSAPATAPVAAPAGLSIEAAKPYIDQFGDRGAKWYLEGKSVSDCLSIVNAEQVTQIQSLSAKITDLETRLAAAIKATGETEELSATPPPVVVDPKKAEAMQKAADLKQKGADPKVAKFAAALSAN